MQEIRLEGNNETIQLSGKVQEILIKRKNTKHTS